MDRLTHRADRLATAYWSVIGALSAAIVSLQASHAVQEKRATNMRVANV